MNSTTLRGLAFVPLLLFSLMSAGCLDSDFDEPPTEFVLNATPVGENERFELEGDELQINSITFAVNNIEVTASGENEIFEPTPIPVRMNAADMTGLTRLGIAELFGGDYTGVKMDLIVPPTDGSVNVPELIDEDDNGNIENVHSVVITGRYNSLAFSISSDREEVLEFSFDRTITMPETDGVLEVTLVSEWRQWFTSSGGDRLLDPDIPEDRDEILDNFTRFFTAETFTLNEL